MQVRVRFFLVNESSSGLFESFVCSILTCSRGDGFTTLLSNLGLMDPDRGACLCWFVKACISCLEHVAAKLGKSTTRSMVRDIS